MTCGDTQAAFVDATNGSVFSGTVNDLDATLVLLPVNQLAWLVVDGVPFVGSWLYSFSADPVEISLQVIAVIPGIGWSLQYDSTNESTSATCTDDVVTSLAMQAVVISSVANAPVGGSPVSASLTRLL